MTDVNIISAEELPSLVGLPLTDPRIQSFLSSLNLPRRVEIKPGDGKVFLYERGLGIELIFEDEKDIVKRLHSYKDGEPVLSCIRLYIRREGDMHPYPGKIPFGIAGAMREADIKKLLGEPSFQNAALGIMRWDTPAVSTAVRTEKNNGPVRTVSMLLWS